MMNKITMSDIKLSSWNRLPAIFLSLGILGLTFAHPAFAQEKMLKTITVTGRGVERIPTTKAQVELGVEVSGKTATGVQQEVAKRSSAVVELLRSRNVEKLETTGIRLNPNYSYENNVQRLTGYVATNTVSFRLDTQKVGSLLDDAVKAGATRIDGISFVANDSAIEAATQTALRKATQDAQRQADSVLGALNLTRREIVNIQVNGASPPPPVPMPRLTSSLAKSDAITPVVGGEQQVEGSVTLQISY